MSPPLHPDAQAILSRLQREKIPAFYHFTSVRNLPDISRAQALCSKETLQAMGMWPPPVPGGNELSHRLDRRNRNWDKVGLNLTPFTPMAYRKKREQHLCFFVIRPEVAAWSGVVFTDTNAASSGQRREEGLAGLDIIDFQAIRSDPRPGDRDGWLTPVQAEVLVPDKIALQYVEEVAFVSSASRAHARRLWGARPHPEFTVKGQLFADSSGSSRQTIGFPYVMSIVLCDAKVDRDTAWERYSHKGTFSKSESDRITLVATVGAMAGTRAEVKWLGADTTHRAEFPKADDYRHCPHISLDTLSQGAYCVEYWLDRLCWASVGFEVIS